VAPRPVATEEGSLYLRFFVNESRRHGVPREPSADAIIPSEELQKARNVQLTGIEKTSPCNQKIFIGDTKRQ